MKKILREISVGLMVLGSLLVSVPALASAQEDNGSGGENMHGGMNGMNTYRSRMPGVFGTVSAINGSTLTLESKGRGSNSTTTTYSVNASGATVMKNGATSTLSSVAVGDMISAEGTVNGTNVTATKLRDGRGMGVRDGKGDDEDGMGRGMGPGGAPGIAGDGNPVIGGTITAITGSTLTLTNKSNVTYTVDASRATVVKGNSSSTVSAVAVGDMVLVQGTVNGNAVVASSVTDRGVPRAPEAQQGGNTADGQHPQGGMGFFGGIRNFFRNLFGFF